MRPGCSYSLRAHRELLPACHDARSPAVILMLPSRFFDGVIDKLTRPINQVEDDAATEVSAAGFPQHTSQLLGTSRKSCAQFGMPVPVTFRSLDVPSRVIIVVSPCLACCRTRGKRYTSARSVAHRAARSSGLTLKKATIDDVASLAGVGRTTVSRVLNNGPNVREEIRQRVRRAVKMLDYKINIQARNLAVGSGRQIALIYASDLETEPNSYYHAGLEIGALRACAAHGFHLVAHTVSPNGASTDNDVIALIEGGHCDGMILTPPLSDRLKLVERICSEGCPLVCISAGIEVQRAAASVGIDDNAAGFAIATYLLDLGHRRFGYILGLSGHLSAERRFDGFLRAIQARGIAADQIQVERGSFTFHSGIEAAQRLLARKKRPTALACANDDMAAGALLTIHKMGLDIPGDISVTGFDDTPVSEIVWPPLTTVHQPIKTLGQSAVGVIIEAVAAGRRSIVARRQTVEFQLVVRESCAPPSR